jgi:hypothetical protein
MDLDWIAGIAGPAHGFAGAVALTAAVLAMLMPKGTRPHRLFGRLFFWALLVMFVAGMSFAFIRQHLFLMLALALAFYLAISGYRALYLKRWTTNRFADLVYRPGPQDKGSAHFLLVVSAVMVAWVITDLARQPLAIAMLLCGVVGVLLALRDLRRFRQGDADDDAWLFRHLWRMPASALALVVAFAAANMPDWLDPWRWVVPAVLGSAAIYLALEVYRRRLLVAGSVEAMVTVRIGPKSLDDEPPDDGPLDDGSL